jgi:hypothetical protein
MCAISDGGVNEDVFAYSNRAGDERSLVVCHNRFARAAGWIRTSAAYSVKNEAGERSLVQRTLSEGLGISGEAGLFTLFRDSINGLEYIRSNQELIEQGLYIELEAYKYHVFTDFRSVQDDEWNQYANLADYLAGQGVPNIQQAMKEIFLRPVHYPFRDLVNKGFFRWAEHNRLEALKDLEDEDFKLEQVLEEGYEKSLALFSAVRQLAGGPGDEEQAARDVKRKLEAALSLPALAERYPWPRSRKYQAALKYLAGPEDQQTLAWAGRLAWLFTHSLGRMQDEDDALELSRSWLDEWLLGKLTARTLIELDVPEEQTLRMVQLLKLLIGHQDWCLRFLKSKDRAYQTLQSWLRDGEGQRFLGVNRYQGVLWYKKEAIDELLWWMFNVAVIQIVAEGAGKKPGAAAGEAETGLSAGEVHPVAERITACYEVIRTIQAAEAAAGYRLDKLVAGTRSQA